MPKLVLSNGRSAALPSSEPSRLKPGIDPLPNEGPLEFGKRGKDAEYQLPLRTCRVDFLCETFHGNATLFQHFHRVDKLPH